MTRQWIERRLKEVKKRKGALGRTLNLPPSRVSEIIRGARRIQSHEILSLAVFLEMDLESVLEHISKEKQTGSTEKACSRTEQIVVIGTLNHSGNQYKLWPDSDCYTITLPKQARFPGICKFAFEEHEKSHHHKGLHICIQEKDLVSAKKSELKKLYDSRMDERPALHRLRADLKTTSDELAGPKTFLTIGTVAITIGKYQHL